MYASKLGFKREILLNTLWGDYYLNAKTKRIMKHAQVLKLFSNSNSIL